MPKNGLENNNNIVSSLSRDVDMEYDECICIRPHMGEKNDDDDDE
jgi:hypothetical protein